MMAFLSILGSILLIPVIVAKAVAAWSILSAIAAVVGWMPMALTAAVVAAMQSWRKRKILRFRRPGATPRPPGTGREMRPPTGR
jgi:hypothetical protein